MFKIIFQRPNIPPGVLLVLFGSLLGILTPLKLWPLAFIGSGIGLILIVDIPRVGLPVLGVGGLLFLIALWKEANKWKEAIDSLLQGLGFQ